MELQSIHHGVSGPILATLELIHNAKESVSLLTYAMEGGGMIDDCLVATLNKTKAKNIRVLTNKKWWETNHAIHCTRTVIQMRAWSPVDFQIYHSKFVIVDHRFVVMGGFNFEEVFFKTWSDCCLIFESPEIAKQLQQYFEIIWNKSKKMNCVESKVEPHCEEKPKLETSHLFNPPISIEKYHLLLQHPRIFRFHAGKSPAFEKLKSYLEDATQTIDIISPNVVDSCLWSVITEQLQRGVRVRIVTNLEQDDNLQANIFLLQHEHHYFCKNTRRLPLLQIRYANYPHQKSVTRVMGKKFHDFIDHTKFICVDMEHVYFGSFNLDVASMHNNGEIGLIFSDINAAKQIMMFLFAKVWNTATPIVCG